MFAAHNMLMTSSPPPNPSWLATGAGTVGTSSPLSYTDTIPAATNCTLIWVNNLNSALTPTISASVGGTAATLVNTTLVLSSTNKLYITLFALLNPPTGPKAISFTSTSLTDAAVTAVHYQNVASVGTPTALGSQTGQPSMSVSSTSVNNMYAQSFTYGQTAAGNTFSAYSQTQRQLVAGSSSNNDPLLIGDASGNGATLTFSATRSNTTNTWGGIIVPLIGWA